MGSVSTSHDGQRLLRCTGTLHERELCSCNSHKKDRSTKKINAHVDPPYWPSRFRVHLSSPSFLLRHNPFRRDTLHDVSFREWNEKRRWQKIRHLGTDVATARSSDAVFLFIALISRNMSYDSAHSISIDVSHLIIVSTFKSEPLPRFM